MFVVLKQIIKYFMQPFINFLMEIGEMSATVVITGITQVKNFIVRNNSVKAMTMPVRKRPPLSGNCVSWDAGET